MLKTGPPDGLDRSRVLRKPGQLAVGFQAPQKELVVVSAGGEQLLVEASFKPADLLFVSVKLLHRVLRGSHVPDEDISVPRPRGDQVPVPADGAWVLKTIIYRFGLGGPRCFAASLTSQRRKFIFPRRSFRRRCGCRAGTTPRSRPCRFRAFRRACLPSSCRRSKCRRCFRGLGLKGEIITNADVVQWGPVD